MFLKYVKRSSVVLAQDETDLLLFPPLRAAFATLRSRLAG